MAAATPCHQTLRTELERPFCRREPRAAASRAVAEHGAGRRRWPARCGCGHEFIADELVAVGKPVDHQVEELPRLAALVTEHQCPGSLPGLWQA
jgi:hypothetical protein